MFSDRLIDIMRNASKTVVLTGAGVSAESGVPTFRGEEGLWKKYRPEELANVNAFMKNPQLVWEWYEYRRRLIHEVRPNAGHFALVEMEKRLPEFWLVTQNVDGLHRAAGSHNVLELHGNIMRSRCIECGEFAEVSPDEEGGPPRCWCGGLLRPDVVWFGEMLPQDVIHSAVNASESCDLFFCVGTSAVVQPAASLPEYARRSGAFVVEVNPEPTVISERVDESLRGKSGDILPLLVQAVWGG